MVYDISAFPCQPLFLFAPTPAARINASPHHCRFPSPFSADKISQMCEATGGQPCTKIP